MENYFEVPFPYSRWRWSWNSLCGPDGLKIWSTDNHDLGLCFQQLFLQIPVLFIFACVSSYYVGKNNRPVSRGAVQLLSISLRSLACLFMAGLPCLQVYIDLNFGQKPISKISFFLCAVQSIAWITHFFFTLSLRKRFGISHRGPVKIRVIWSLLLVLTVVSLRSHMLRYKYSGTRDYSVNLSFTFTMCHFVVQIFYFLSLIPGKGNSVLLANDNRRISTTSENSPLLNVYVRLVDDDGEPAYLGVAMDNVSSLSKLFFSWVNPLMEKGAMEKLRDSEDLFDLPQPMNCTLIGSKVEKHLIGNVDKYIRRNGQDYASISTITTVHSQEIGFKNHHNVSLLRALHRCFWKEFYGLGILKFIGDCSGFAGPLLLNRLVGLIENKSENVGWGYAYASGLGLVTLIGALCNSHFLFAMSVVGLKMRAAVVTAIYRKTLAVNSATLSGAFSVGEIVNFMSTDTDRIVNSCPSFHALWSIPFQLFVTLYLLYTQVGLAFLAGVVFSVTLIPINKCIASKIGELSTKLMEEKDGRVKVITEVLRGIKAVKFYVWEQHFIRVVSKLREKELHYLKWRKYLDALCVFFWATTPVLVSLLTFGTYVLLGNKLTAATVFTGIALLNMLISPLNAFPWVLNGLTEAWVSFKRIQRILDLPELDLELYYDNRILEGYRKNDIVIKNGSFNWGKTLSAEEKRQLHSHVKIRSKKGKGKGKNRMEELAEVAQESENNVSFQLYNVNLRISMGEFIGVMGKVASGKSTLLSAILAELNMTEGEIATIYADSGFGLVTQQPWLQRGTIRDNILFGRTYEDARYKSVIFACGLADDLSQLSDADLTDVGEGGTTLSGGQRARVALARAVYQDKSVYLFDDILSAVDVKVARHIFQHCVLTLLKDKTRILCTHLVEYLVYANRIIHLEDGKIKNIGKAADILKEFDPNLLLDLELGDAEPDYNPFLNSLSENVKKVNNDETNKESSERGSVNLDVFRSYLRAVGCFLVVVILASLTSMQVSRNATDWWLSHWVTADENITNDTYDLTNIYESGSSLMDMDYYFKIYVELAIFNSFFTFLRAFLFAYGGVVAATRIHRMLLKSILKAKCKFFDTSPVGRILNRFSSDTYTVDDSLPFIMNILLAQFFGLLGTLAITVYGLPWICLVLVPLIPVYHWLQHNYRLTSRELKRISSVTLSPVYCHFNETLLGLTTIRAMRATKRFKRENEENMEANLKAQFSSQAASCWLGLRLQFIGVAMVVGVSFIAVIQHHYDIADPGLIGLAMSYALSVTGALGAVISAFTETEREMIAVERVRQYINEVPSETTYCVRDPPFGWPSQGVVIFKDVVLKYGENLPPSLNRISFETRPMEKIGVVGRTGAGKSSLITALFRMTDITSGSIQIDMVDIAQISIPALRSRLFCIPQEPFLFGGSIRENLDPLGEFRDNELWSALNKVSLSDIIRGQGGLEAPVESGGSNFSMGQKQLICLARAMLHNAKILCIDEATANVDYETDRLIQSTLRSAFRNSTVLTIAHRMETIRKSDRVILMDGGEIVQIFDSPDDFFISDTRLDFNIKE